MTPWRNKAICLLWASSFLSPISLISDESTDLRRDRALQGIERCLRRNEVSSRECKNLNKDIEILVGVYRQGDRSVLPTLFRFKSLRDFYGDALISDPEFFLQEISRLSEKDQQAVAAGIAGPVRGLPKARFEVIRATLQKIPESSLVYAAAHMCLHTLDIENASFLADYFPPQTFRDLLLHWYSRQMFAMELRPIWPPTSTSVPTFRITLLPSFTPPQSVSLIVLGDGTGQVEFRTVDPTNLHAVVDDSRTISPQQVAEFKLELDRADFWQMPTEMPFDLHHVGFDGAQWILEGVKDENYHVVDRWCAGRTPFGKMTLELFRLAGREAKGGC